MRSLTGFGEGAVAGNLRDSVEAGESRPAARRDYRFMLAPGSYVANVLVRERATGRMFAETISF